MHLPKAADVFLIPLTTIYQLLLPNSILHAVSLDYIIPLVALNNSNVGSYYYCVSTVMNLLAIQLEFLIAR